MRAEFVRGVSNVERFLADTTRVDRRGASEACWHLAEGNPGYGKTGTLEWWMTHAHGVYVRAKATWTPKRMLEELVSELGQKPQGLSGALYRTVVERVLEGQRPIIVDEIDHCLHDRKVIETLRDISDLTKTPIVIGGMAGVSKSLKRYDQIHSRIAAVTVFQASTLEDTATVCAALVEGTSVADDMVALIHQRTGGRLRLIKNAAAQVERFGRTNGKATVCAADMPPELLTNDGQSHAAPVRRVA